MVSRSLSRLVSGFLPVVRLLLVQPEDGSCAFRLRVVLDLFGAERAVFLFAVARALHFVALTHTLFLPFAFEAQPLFLHLWLIQVPINLH